jgi:hypothetical protein
VSFQDAQSTHTASSPLLSLLLGDTFFPRQVPNPAPDVSLAIASTTNLKPLGIVYSIGLPMTAQNSSLNIWMLPLLPAPIITLFPRLSPPFLMAFVKPSNGVENFSPLRKVKQLRFASFLFSSPLPASVNTPGNFYNLLLILPAFAVVCSPRLLRRSAH